MKRLAFLIIGSFMAAGLYFSVPAGAAEIQKKDLCGGANLSFADKAKGCNVDSQGDELDKGAQGSVNDLIADIINILSVIVGIVAVIMIIWGGFKFITSGGDAGRLTSAKQTILYALIGLVIVALAQFIVRFVLGKTSEV